MVVRFLELVRKYYLDSTEHVRHFSDLLLIWSNFANQEEDSRWFAII